MSKSAILLMLTVLCTLLITGATFFIPTHNPAATCYPLDNVIDSTTGVKSFAKDSAPIEASARGFPFWYYQEPFPANCIPSGDMTHGSFNGENLLGDLIMWVPLACVISMVLIRARTKND